MGERTRAATRAKIEMCDVTIDLRKPLADVIDADYA